MCFSFLRVTIEFLKRRIAGGACCVRAAMPDKRQVPCRPVAFGPLCRTNARYLAAQFLSPPTQTSACNVSLPDCVIGRYCGVGPSSNAGSTVQWTEKSGVTESSRPSSSCDEPWNYHLRPTIVCWTSPIPLKDPLSCPPKTIYPAQTLARSFECTKCPGTGSSLSPTIF